ncbi:BBOX1 [Branchiostoma lanceolatum]|uniref:BBOX1 protein n=1 Tax=Branchiostoma lanceolatum TaxID=7740 RepID=A0A8K0EEX3_BRALA|nr:BBOX1 [Branchiostoma lanceolatum]
MFQGVSTLQQQQQLVPVSRAVFSPHAQVVATRRFSAFSRSPEFQESVIMEKVGLNEAARMVEVEWSGGGVSRFPYVWLRDNCQCPQCFNPDSRSRLVLMSDLDVNVSPVRVELQARGGLLSVDWQDGHKSQYDQHWLKKHCLSIQALSKRQKDWQRKTKLWGAELTHDLPKADFHALLTNDLALYDFLVRLDSLGLVLVQNVPCDVGQVERLANRVAFLKQTSFGLNEGEVQSISYNNQTRASILDLPADLVQPFYDALKAFNTIIYLPRNCLSLKMAAVVATRRFSAFSRSPEFQESVIMEKVGLNEAARMVEVEWSGGGVSRFPYVWLRDNCQCPQCFNPDSRSRLVLMSDLDVNVSPVRVELQARGGLLSVDWQDGHKSQYDQHWLKKHCLSIQALSKRQKDWQRKTKLWGAELTHDLPKADFHALLTNDLALYDFLVRLDSLGLVLVQNVPCDVGQVERLANRVAFLKQTSFGKEFVVMSKTNPSDLAYTSVDLGLHTDLNYYNYKPRVPARPRAGSPDGRSQLEGDPTRGGLGPRVMRNTSLNEGEVQSISYNNQTRASVLDLPADLVQPFYDALKAFNTIIYLPRNCLSLKMAAGEMIVFDNTRTLHGRAAYSPDSGTRHLQGGYMDWDEIYSRKR